MISLKIHFIALFLCFFFLIGFVSSAFSQQYSLYNSRTLFDVFENPSQKAFYTDTTRKYAFNFLFPTISLNTSFAGPGQSIFKSRVFAGTYNPDEIILGENKVNTAAVSVNTYLAMFRIFRQEKYNIEMGFSWQMRNDGYAKITNETLGIQDKYENLPDGYYQNIFNNKGFNQSYHQFGFTYREDYDKRLSLGAKFSLLSGITYHQLIVDRSDLTIYNDVLDEHSTSFKGRLRSSFDVTNNVDSNIIYPTFKHPGLAISASASYKFKGGWFLLGNLKDLGFIKWNKKSYTYTYDEEDININNSSNNQLTNDLKQMIEEGESQGGFITPVNSKIEVLLNKDFGNYQPNLILSKNIFYGGGDVALINNYRYTDLVFTLSANYNPDKGVYAGGQFMIKTPNTEFFIGSDQILQTFYTTRSFSSESVAGKGYAGASLYLGMAFKFGPVIEHPANATSMPGFPGEIHSGGQKPGFFKRLFD
ncbi:MAG: DUF5723 family protein [Daejeonella sp.]